MRESIGFWGFGVLGFRVLGFRGFGFRVWGLGLGVWGLGFIYFPYCQDWELGTIMVVLLAV